jgi:hypothetical protein
MPKTPAFEHESLTRAVGLGYTRCYRLLFPSRGLATSARIRGGQKVTFSDARPSSYPCGSSIRGNDDVGSDLTRYDARSGL